MGSRQMLSTATATAMARRWRTRRLRAYAGGRSATRLLLQQWMARAAGRAARGTPGAARTLRAGSALVRRRRSAWLASARCDCIVCRGRFSLLPGCHRKTKEAAHIRARAKLLP